jgi:DNA-binding Xre family transcriptional regulator
MEVDMAVRWRIKQLMAEREQATGERESYRKIAKETKISPNTLSALATGKAEQVGTGTIEGLLKYFNCKPNDLIVLVED